ARPTRSLDKIAIIAPEPIVGSGLLLWRWQRITSSPRGPRSRSTHPTICGATVSEYFPTAAECGQHRIFPGVHIRTAACARMMLSLVDLEPNSVVAEHDHPHEQVGMVIEGRAIFYIGDEQQTLGPGDFY